MKKLVLATILLALGSLGFAADSAKSTPDLQQQAAAAAAQQIAAHAALLSPFATSTCSFTFTSGTNENFIKYCVTVNGNITQLETPLGHEHIAAGVFGEGYGLCDATNGILTAYFDYADFGDSPNWLPATVVSHSANSVKIARTTLDGIWTLTQTITQVAGASPSVKVVMTIKNNTAVDRPTFLLRYADIDANSLFINSLGATANNAFAWDPSVFENVGIRANFGVSLQADAIPPPGVAGDQGSSGFTQNTPAGPSPCDPLFSFFSGLDQADDGSVVALYGLTVPAKGSRTVTVHYTGM